MTGHRIKIGGSFRIKGGKVEKGVKHLDAAARARQRGSKRIKVARRQPR
jgi:hypothetical protein